MPINPMYHSWLQWIGQLRPEERITRRRNLAWLMTGIYLSRSVHLSRIASKMPGPAKLLSQVRRMSRFLNNRAIQVRDWYEPIARHLLESAANSVGEIRLIVDGSKVGFGHQLLMVAIAFRGRAIPIAWTWIKGAKGHSSGYKQCALIAYVHQLVPADTPVSIVGDSEFGVVPVIRQLEAWNWQYVLRQKANHRVKLSEQSEWQHLGNLIQNSGQSLWFDRGVLTLKYAYCTNLLLHWQAGEREPWLLATNCVSHSAALRAYRRRMWIEEMFGDLKGHGFDLESTHLHHFLRISRLTLAVVLLYVWLISTGSRVVKNGHRHLVDRTDRRDLSYFQIGMRTIERYLANAFQFSIRLHPTFS
jgi:hypothetical protein